MNDIQFTPRQDGIEPIFVGIYRIGGAGMIAPWEPSPSDVVTLRVDQVEVVVRIRAVKDRKYVGVVIGLENIDQPQYRGIGPDGEVAFEYRHILTCMH
jgi:hypothetical protein